MDRIQVLYHLFLDQGFHIQQGLQPYQASSSSSTLTGPSILIHPHLASSLHAQAPSSLVNAESKPVHTQRGWNLQVCGQMGRLHGGYRRALRRRARAPWATLGCDGEDRRRGQKPRQTVPSRQQAGRRKPSGSAALLLLALAGDKVTLTESLRGVGAARTAASLTTQLQAVEPP